MSIDPTPVPAPLESIDRRIAGFMWKYGHFVLRMALGIIFIWFGSLKFFPGLSPAAELVERTIYWLPPSYFIPVLAAWEVLIGICLLVRPLIRLGIFLLFAQMVGTFLPLVVLPEATWRVFPYAPTMEGQYILKNLVIIGAALVIGGTVREVSLKRHL
jgi:uncharacterized membrane protein YphA (DoxX/SURF4 family)